MANKNLFSSLKSLLPRADARNEAGGRAYRLPPTHALAQLAATGCFNGTYYADGRGAARHPAGAGRRRWTTTSSWPSWRSTAASSAFMKDMPAALLRACCRSAIRPCSAASSTASSTTAACCARCSR